MLGNMMGAVGIALVAAMLSLVIGKQASGIAFLMTLAAGVLILIGTLQTLRGILAVLYEMLAAAELESEVYLPVLQAVGIAVVVRVAAELCRDAGQGALAAKLEISGALAAVVVSLPLFQKVLEMVSSMLGYAG